MRRIQIGSLVNPCRGNRVSGDIVAIRESDHGSMVAIGRCMTDWARYACIYDVIIRPDWQRQGIGSVLMRAILRDLVEADVSMFHLWPTKGKVPFYEGLGFRAASQEQPVMTIKQDDARAMLKAESRAKS